MKTMAIVQRKGGNGKSTASLNLAYAFAALYHKKVLLVDADDQRNTTSCIPTKRPAVKDLESLLLEEAAGVADVAEQAVWEGIDLIAGSSGLSMATAILEEYHDQHLVLRNKLQSDAYDICLIDTSPSLNMLTINALLASTGLFIPLASSYFSLQGLAQTLEAYGKVTDSLYRELKLYGAAFVIHDGRTRLANEVQETVKAQYPQVLCETVIGRNIKIEEAQVRKQPIFTYAPDDRGAAQYRLLADELAGRMGL